MELPYQITQLRAKEIKTELSSLEIMANDFELVTKFEAVLLIIYDDEYITYDDKCTYTGNGLLFT